MGASRDDAMADEKAATPGRCAQLRDVLGKQGLVRKRSRSHNLMIVLIPLVGLLLAFLFYQAFGGSSNESTGFLELVFVPIGLIMLLIVFVTNLVGEKADRLVETMKIMGLKEDVYYAAYAIEGVCVGAVMAAVLASVAVAMGLFNGGGWLEIFGLLFAFSFATTAFAFFVASMFDSPQTAVQVALLLQVLAIVLFFVLIGPDLKKSRGIGPTEQRLWCLLPPMALELGINSFRGPPTQDKFTRPEKKNRYGYNCDRISDVKWAINCPELESDYGIPNSFAPVPEVLYEVDTTYEDYDVYEDMLVGSRNYVNPYRFDYSQGLPAGDCYDENEVCFPVTDFTSVADGGACIATCQEQLPGFVAVGYYPSYGPEDDDNNDDDGEAAECCCKASCDCTVPSDREGRLIAKQGAALADAFCEDSITMSMTYRKKKKYTQYQGIKLGDIIGMLFLDVIVYSILAWYLGQVVPSQFGVSKPWYFPCLCGKKAAPPPAEEKADRSAGGEVVAEPVHRDDAPLVHISGLRKVFGPYVAVDDLRFDIHANEIFSLLGHNGAGKSTSINVLTGILASDSAAPDGGATIFGHPIRGDMDGARSVTGVCPQHDVLFQKLTTREHLTFFARLKGSDKAAAGAEADELLAQFHLSERGGHLGHELSGGMRRKLSTAIALCGRSKFVLLDEPTAGMDALARRELWDLLGAAKAGRTVLLTTHYMDEADVLGDRIGIMSHGKLKCVGTSRFLKQHYGAGYRVVCERAPGSDDRSLAAFDELLADKLPEGKRVPTMAKRKVAEPTFEATLPIDALPEFGAFFKALDGKLDDLKVSTYGLKVTTLEEVFLAVGADETVAPKAIDEGKLQIGGGRKFKASLPVQVMGLAIKRLDIARHDAKSVALVFLPIIGCLAAFICAAQEVMSKKNSAQDQASLAIAAVSNIFVPCLLAEQIVRERERKLKDVLAVMGVDFRAYWLGTFLGDSILLSVVWLLYWIVVPATGLSRYLDEGIIFWFLPLLYTYFIVQAYALSWLFSSSKVCLWAVFALQLFTFLIPFIIVLIFYLIVVEGAGLSESEWGDRVSGGQYWLVPIFSPFGAMWMSLYIIVDNPPRYAPCCIWIMFLIVVSMGTIYTLITYVIEVRREKPLKVTYPDAEVAAKAEGDADVVREREVVAAMGKPTPGGPSTLVVKRLRKVYPPKGSKATETVAVHDCSFRVGKGECFGLLGANGAGKSTTMDMVIRATIPTAGDAFVDGKSTLTDFHHAAEALGVVAQGNTLWDKLSCEDHLKLFARIRGVPGKEAKDLVEAALDQLELRPHAKKLAERLSGGMKRKLCVAIAIVGDPECVLLDEPSAGLDPVSRRNLWNIIRATMDTRSVVLTSHLMEEVEALCDRVAIMVKGKLRCLGTIQHLKHALGKHYEVVLAVDADKFAADPAKASAKLRGLAAEVLPGATEDGDPKAGIFTYNVPQETMKIGDVFESLQERGSEVDLVDYTIAQPSLESVFIRTVLDYSGDERPGAAGSRADRALRAKALSRDEDDFDEPGHTRGRSTSFNDPDVALYEALDDKPTTCTGCSRRTHWWLAACCWPLAIIGIVIGLGGVGVAFVVGILFLVVAIWGSVGCCCRLKLQGDVKPCLCCGSWRISEERATPCCKC